MRIISEKAITEFWEIYPESESSMKDWISKIRDADWQTFSDIKQTFNTADNYKRCVVFNVGGNNYRVIGIVEYQKHLVFIRAILTHKEYDKDKWKIDCK